MVHPADFLTTRAKETLEWATKSMTEGTFDKQRDDYRELFELVAEYLGGQVIRRRKDGSLIQHAFEMRYPRRYPVSSR